MRRTCLLAACLTIAAATPGALEPGQLEPTGAAAHQRQGLPGTDIAVRIIALPNQADVASTLAHYVREAHAALAAARLDSDQRRLVDRLAALAPTLLGPAYF